MKLVINSEEKPQGLSEWRYGYQATGLSTPIFSFHLLVMAENVTFCVEGYHS